MRERRPDQWSRAVGDRVVVAFCDPSLRVEVEALFRHLVEISRQGVELRGEQEIGYAWTTLTLRDRQGRLEVWEPDYDRDAEARARPSVTASLRVRAAQESVLRHAKAVRTPVNFDQHILVSKKVWNTDELLFARVVSPGGRMSGWRIVPSELESGIGEIESIPLHALYRRAPEMLAPLLLPPGYMVLLRAREVVTIVDPDDVIVWTRTADAGSEVQARSLPGITGAQAVASRRSRR